MEHPGIGAPVRAIAGTASAIFFNHCQCCCAGSRLYAHESVFDEVVEGVSAEAGKIRLGLGLDPDTDMDPLVSEEEFQRITGFLEFRSRLRSCHQRRS